MHSKRINNLLKQELTDENAVGEVERAEKVQPISEAKDIQQLASQVAIIANTVSEQSSRVSYQMLAMIQASNNSLAERAEEKAEEREKEINLKATIHRNEKGLMESVSIVVTKA